MLHLIKLAVGVRDIAHLRAIQEARAAADPPLRHQTRARPTRAAEVTGGGSLYWVIAGAVLVRQRVTAIVADHWDDGSACAGLVLDPALVPVEPRAMKPFQGWRYLLPADAPADRGAAGAARRDTDMPPALANALRELCLL